MGSLFQALVSGVILFSAVIFGGVSSLVLVDWVVSGSRVLCVVVLGSVVIPWLFSGIGVFSGGGFRFGDGH